MSENTEWDDLLGIVNVWMCRNTPSVSRLEEIAKNPRVIFLDIAMLVASEFPEHSDLLVPYKVAWVVKVKAKDRLMLHKLQGDMPN